MSDTVQVDVRKKIVRLVALRLMAMEVPGAPAGALGPPSVWWSMAEDVVDHVLPYLKKAIADGEL